MTPIPHPSQDLFDKNQFTHNFSVIPEKIPGYNRMFKASFEDLILKLGQVDTSNFQQVYSLAHELKGVLANFFAVLPQNLCKNIEVASDQKDQAEIATHIEALKLLKTDIFQQLDQLCASVTTPE